MNTEQERAAFEAWAASIGFCVTGKYAETIDVLCAESAFKAGYQAGRAALQSQHDEETKRLRDALKLARDRARGFMNDSGADTDSLPEIDAAIDHARHIEESK